MMENTAILGMIAETSIHAGAGGHTGVVDLPIQREAHTNWPCIYGSGMKGALRALAEQRAETDAEKADIKQVFGHAALPGKGSEHAGAMLISDARLLLLPVRSLTSHYRWVCCPALLQRLQQDCRRFGPEFKELWGKISEPGFEEVIIATERSTPLYLEDLELQPKKQAIGWLIDILERFLPLDNARVSLTAQLAIVNNDLFHYLVSFATPVVPHIALEPKTKTVKTGALWYEESLPPDTCMYTGIATLATRNNSDQGMDSSEVLDYLFDTLLTEESPYLQAGGNETVGMGWFRTQRVIDNA